MQTHKRHFIQNLSLVVFGAFMFTANSVMAESDMVLQERVLKAREMLKGDHSNHIVPIEKSLDFHGVFYGYLPCKGCNGIKATLSLKQRNNYLLVTQPAKESSRETYEKGKYTWNEATKTAVLTERATGNTRQYRIEDEGTLIQLNSDGSAMAGNKEDFTLRRSDTVKARQVHIH